MSDPHDLGAPRNKRRGKTVSRGQPMKAEYDFSKAERGKFYNPSADFSFPSHLDLEIGQSLVRSNSKSKGPQFVTFFWPVIRALQELGGSGKPGEVIQTIARDEEVSEEVQQERLKSGKLRFNNQVHFARQYLVWGGLLESSEHGVWSLTDSGRSLLSLSREKALNLFRREHALHKGKKNKEERLEEDLEFEKEDVTPSYKETVLQRLREGLSPKGFEHFCKRLLREYGFERVAVTGGPRDKGLDGEGILKINPFMSFRVVFQCKRYADAVTSSHVSTFRGSIPSNADKGILITTGYFTADAIKMAQEPGLKPIELIDGDQLVALMEELELGLRPTYILDNDFFEDFGNGCEQDAPQNAIQQRR